MFYYDLNENFSDGLSGMYVENMIQTEAKTFNWMSTNTSGLQTSGYQSASSFFLMYTAPKTLVYKVASSEFVINSVWNSIAFSAEYFFFEALDVSNKACLTILYMTSCYV